MEQLDFQDCNEDDKVNNFRLDCLRLGQFKAKFIQQLNQRKTRDLTFIKSLQITFSQTFVPAGHIFDNSGPDIIKRQDIIQQQIKMSVDYLKSVVQYDDKPINNVSEMLKNAQQTNRKGKITKIHFIQVVDEQNQLYIEKTSQLFFEFYQGEAILILPDGRRIQGIWSNGITKGNVKMTYPSQIIYYGPLNFEFQKHGPGFIYYPNKQKIQGNFVCGRLTGKVVHYDKEGRQLNHDQFINGLMISSKKA